MLAGCQAAKIAAGCSVAGQGEAAESGGRSEPTRHAAGEYSEERIDYGVSP
jgi:hypothetical protein